MRSVRARTGVIRHRNAAEGRDLATWIVVRQGVLEVLLREAPLARPVRCAMPYPPRISRHKVFGKRNRFGATIRSLLDERDAILTEQSISKNAGGA